MIFSFHSCWLVLLFFLFLLLLVLVLLVSILVLFLWQVVGSSKFFLCLLVLKRKPCSYLVGLVKSCLLFGGFFKKTFVFSVWLGKKVIVFTFIVFGGPKENLGLLVCRWLFIFFLEIESCVFIYVFFENGWYIGIYHQIHI